MNTLKRWTLPSNYCGKSWPEYFRAGVRQSRDSDALERANFDAMLAALKAVGEPEGWTRDFAPFQIVREPHWAVGWLEWIAIHETATVLLECASEIMEKFDGYPVIDEERMNQYETDEANEPQHAPDSTEFLTSENNYLRDWIDRSVTALRKIEGRLDRWQRSGIEAGPKGLDADWPQLCAQTRAAIANRAALETIYPHEEA